MGDFNHHWPIDLDGKSLSAEETKQLRKMIEDANFFDLSSSPTPPPNIPDPPAGYDLTVEMDGRTHHVWLVDGDVSKALKPLIDWLRVRSDALEEEIQRHVTPASVGESPKLARLLTDVRSFDLPEEHPTHASGLFAEERAERKRMTIVSVDHGWNRASC